MEALDRNKNILTIFGFCSTTRDTKWYIYLRNHLTGIFAIFSLVWAMYCSSSYIIHYVKTDLEGALYALFQVAAVFSYFQLFSTKKLT